ncbi:exo-alpha-sialidase [Mucilaginibacter mali]|uniref:Exo-alpha-sialidase n=1 Tax=Mucilaginibacter mali TaxID=2740462 RepID=A0A7D4Q714_9SPHI|nr:sialidase family protein [Mucilaginibacter mali]QKJ32627.1 exo-alpha-sialidase [Mucilaginibacter mali]
MKNKLIFTFSMFLLICTAASAQTKQQVEGFDTVAFHYDANRSRPVMDFRGMTKGYMTAGWWAPEQMKKNILSWKTGIVPEKVATTFSFIAATCVLPSEITVGPQVRLTVNGHYALTFTLGRMKDYTWHEGAYELKYISKRVEFPYTGAHREFGLNGNSGIYQLSVPASAVEAGKAALIEVEILPFERWHNGWFMIKHYRDVLQAATIASLQGQINALRMDANVANEQTHILATQLYSKMLGTDKYRNNVIYTNGYRHIHPADIIKLKNGDILLMAREATEHFANDGDVIMLRSKDGGKTWGEKQVIGGVKDLDEREGCGIQLRDGTILVSMFYNNNYTVDGTYNWEGKGKLPPTDKPRLGSELIRSTDNGHTWSKMTTIDLTGMPFKGIEGPTDAPIEMPDGSILMGVIGYGNHGDSKNIASVMLKSTDKGKSWKYLSTIADDPGGKYDGFVEPGITRTKTGRIVAGMRNKQDENNIWMTYSDDDGKTWAPLNRTDMIGHPVDLIQLKDGRVMATYGVREGPGRHTEPGGVRACFSSDNGKTWDIKTEVQLRNDFINWDVGYPESIQFEDGSVMTVYYFNLFGKYFLGSTFWKP